MAYYYINGIHFDVSKKIIEKLVGYLTDANHCSFFPPQDFPRNQVLAMIKTGNILFVEDGDYRKIIINIYKYQHEEYLRIDNLPLRFDYLG